MQNDRSTDCSIIYGLEWYLLQIAEAYEFRAKFALIRYFSRWDKV
jgi:hypothetical protein